MIDKPDDQLNAEGHYQAPFFGKSIYVGLLLVDDYCALNKRLANLIGVPVVGFASHRLSLAVRECLALYDDLVEQVLHLARKLRTQLLLEGTNPAGSTGRQRFILL